MRIALHWKGIAFERRVVNLIKDGGEQHSDEFRALNPLRQVPVLVPDEGGRPIAQSMAILAYLEERFPTPPLLPPDPWLRARARQLAEMVNAGIQPFQNLPGLTRLKELGVDATAWARDFNARGLPRRPMAGDKRPNRQRRHVRHRAQPVHRRRNRNHHDPKDREPAVEWTRRSGGYHHGYCPGASSRVGKTTRPKECVG